MLVLSIAVGHSALVGPLVQIIPLLVLILGKMLLLVCHQAVGKSALNAISIGNENTAMGESALLAATTGYNNAAFDFSSR